MRLDGDNRSGVADVDDPDASNTRAMENQNTELDQTNHVYSDTHILDRASHARNA